VSDDLIGAEAGQSLGTRVPIRDPALTIDEVHAIGQVVQHREAESIAQPGGTGVKCRRPLLKIIGRWMPDLNGAARHRRWRRGGPVGCGLGDWSPRAAHGGVWRNLAGSQHHCVSGRERRPQRIRPRHRPADALGDDRHRGHADRRVSLPRPPRMAVLAVACSAAGQRVGQSYKIEGRKMGHFARVGRRPQSPCVPTWRCIVRWLLRQRDGADRRVVLDRLGVDRISSRGLVGGLVGLELAPMPSWRRGEVGTLRSAKPP
jgi:hypothetical protein